LKRFAKLLGGILSVVLIGIQLFPNRHNSYEPTSSDDFIVYYNPPQEIQSSLRSACYACHSNQTNYPWYSHIQPFGWFVQNHIDDGRAELNLSEFGKLSQRKKRMKLKSMMKEIEKGGMPLKSYRLMHNKSNLTKIQKQHIIDYLSSK